MTVSLCLNTQMNYGKIFSAIRAMKRIRPYILLHTPVQINNALILLYFDYCCPVWDSLSQQLGKKLQKLKTRAASNIKRASYDARSSELLETLQWDMLSIRQRKQKAIVMS